MESSFGVTFSLLFLGDNIAGCDCFPNRGGRSAVGVVCIVRKIGEQIFA